jgi:hypothetical protein
LKNTRQVLWISLVLVAAVSPRVTAADDKSPFLAPADGALVVFIQNLHEDRSMSYIVFDADKQCVAEVRGREAEVIPMKPGKHTVYVAAYNNHRLDLDLAAGRTYFVRLFSLEKVTTRVSDVTPVQRGTDSYKLLKSWLAGATVVHASDDPCRGKPLKERKNRTQRRLNQANADWKNNDQLYRYEYMLLKEDGLTAEEVGWL